jgi:hypothetical protein
MRIWHNRPLFVIFVAAFCLASATARGAEFAAHRALYTMTLVSAHAGSGIAGVAGKMAVEWRNACTGWTFEYRSDIDVAFAEREPLRLSSSATTWESRDGRDYRFSVRHRTNGEDTERIEGTAVGRKKDKPGRVVFSQPKPRKMTLPAGTLFPIAHSATIMEMLAKSRKPAFLSRMVFDGMDMKGLYQVSAAIGDALPESAGVRPADGSMKGLRSWPVDLAYFDAQSKKPEPDHEIQMHLYANGVADDLVMEFDDFTVRARIGRIELLRDPPCR